MTEEKTFLRIGICTAPIYFVTLIVIAALSPEYSHMSNWVSDLGRVEAPYHKIFNVVIFTIGILFLFTGSGFYHAVNRITERKILAASVGGLVAAFGVNTFFAALFPLPDPRHSAFGIGFLTFFAPVLLSRAFWRVPNSRAFAILQILSFMLISLSTVMANGLSDDTNFGLFQRIQAVAVFGWLTYSCFWLMRYKKS